MPPAAAARITVIASNAVKEALAELVPEFERASPHRVVTAWGGTPDISARIGGGEVLDLVILPAARIDALIAQGRLRGGSRVDIARSGIGVAVRAGTRKPDISSAVALKTALLAARAIVLSSGPSSLYLADLFQQMGIAAAIGAKIVQIGPGLPVAAELARGEGEIGFTQVSELKSAPGIDFLGPLPAEIQHITVWSAGLHTAAPEAEGAAALVEFLRGPHAAEVIRRSGMEPA
jgi:molybdate transport system substrate-binding protein